MDRPHAFGPWLKQRRKARDLTQDALAQQIGCTVTTIRRIEAGTRRPSRQIAERMLHVLAIAPEDQPAIVGEEGLTEYQPFGQTWFRTSFLLHLGIVALDHGDDGRARS